MSRQMETIYIPVYDNYTEQITILYTSSPKVE